MWLTHFWHSWSQFFIFAWDVTAGGILRTGVLICLVIFFYQNVKKKGPMSSRPPRRSLILHFNVCNFKMCSGITVFKMTINRHLFWRRDLDLWLWVVNQHLVLWLPMCKPNHYNDVIMGTIASQITSLTIVCSTAYSGADQREHQSSASLAFVRGIHRDRWIPRTNGQKRRRCFHLMTSSCLRTIWEQTICIEDGRRWADTTVFMILCKTINIPDFHVSFGIFAFEMYVYH